MSGLFPRTDEIAAALVAACRAYGEDPLAAAAGAIQPFTKGGLTAMHALGKLFPIGDYPKLARCCGVDNLTPRAYMLAPQLSWWSQNAQRRAEDAVLFLFSADLQRAKSRSKGAP